MFYSLHRCYLFNRISINLDVLNDGRLFDLVAYTSFLVGIFILVDISNKVLFNLFSISDFNEGGLFEKIVVLGGFLILMIGICRLLPKYKEQKKTVMVVLLGLMGIIALISFRGLLLRLFGIL